MSTVSSFFKSGQTIFVHGLAATPHRLIHELLADISRLKNLTLVHLHTLGDIPWAEDRYAKSIRIRNFFVGSNLRKKLDYHRIDHIPCFLSEVPHFFRSGLQPIDLALLQISPPNKAGLCSLGVTVEAARAAFDSAKIAIGLVNSQMPFVEGDGVVPFSEFDATLEVNEALPEIPRRVPTAEEKKIGEFISGIVEDGSCLQIGIGGLPEAALLSLKNHKNLGLHTEMWSDSALELMESGAITNSQKKLYPGKSVSSFLMGTKAVYDFVNHNPNILQLGVDQTNALQNISANPKAVAINSAVEIDLTGQVCADSVGTRMISGFGGQLDFIRGAALSPGGKAIIALSSRTKSGHPRLVPTLRAGAGVVTTRAHVHYVATEYGIVNLYAKSLSERAKALISIAHPEDRENLDREWRRHWKKSS
jgi:4-hydroxybutyrate CoA-transferase